MATIPIRCLHANDAVSNAKPKTGETKMATDNVSMNADGSMRIERRFEADGRAYLTTMTLSNCITMTVESSKLVMSLFDDLSDTKTFPMGSFAEAWDWASNRAADFRFRGE